MGSSRLCSPEIQHNTDESISSKALTARTAQVSNTPPKLAEFVDVPADEP
jgi:hypothetical protein